MSSEAKAVYRARFIQRCEKVECADGKRRTFSEGATVTDETIPMHRLLHLMRRDMVELSEIAA